MVHDADACSMHDLFLLRWGGFSTCHRTTTNVKRVLIIHPVFPETVFLGRVGALLDSGGYTYSHGVFLVRGVHV